MIKFPAIEKAWIIPAAGAAAAAAIGVLSGGMMRPDESQFVRPGQQLVYDDLPQNVASPVSWPNGKVPDYVIGTDSLRPAWTTYAAADADYRPVSDQEAYGYRDMVDPVAWRPSKDTRPAQDDRADAIREAQATNPEVTAPADRTAAFPSVSGDTVGGMGQASQRVTAVAPRALTTPKPLETIDSLLGQIARDDKAAAKRIAGRPS